MSAHRALRDLFRAFEASGPGVGNDPGDGGTIAPNMWGQQFLITTSASAETRTLAQPNKAGILVSVALDTDGGGDLTLTVTGGYNASSSTAITLEDAGDAVVFLSVKTGSTYQWTLISQDGTDSARDNVVAAILRVAGDGNWTILDDANHDPINATGLVTSSSNLALTYGKTFSKVNSFIVVPDESLGTDFICGATVGLSSANITLSSIGSVGGYIAYNGSAWTYSLTNGVTGTPTFSGGTLTIPVRSYVGALNATVDCRTGVHLVSIGTTGGGNVEVIFRDYAGNLVTTPDTDMKIRLNVGPTANQDPSLVRTDSFASGNLWVYGVFEN